MTSTFPERSLTRLYIGTILLLGLGAGAQLLLPIWRAGVLQTSWKWQLLAAAGLVVGAGLIVILAAPAGLERLFHTVSGRLRAFPRLGGVLFGLSLLALPVLFMGPIGRLFTPYFIRLLAFGALLPAGAALLSGPWPAAPASVRLATAALAYGAVYRLATFYPDLSTYPLSMGWSETSRYYYGSLFLGESIYGVATAPSVLHPSRYLLQAIPFLLPDSPLWLHRFWQAGIWVGLTWLAAHLLIRRLDLKRRRIRGLATLWGFLFLFQGPILFHLLPPVVLVLWGFDSRRPWRSLIVILLASVWAGISRINWYPVPAFMAATIYFLEVPRGNKSHLQYLLLPAVWTLAGSLTAFLAQAGYVIWSGNDPEQFGSSFTSSLLWYRLLPSATYPLGVLPAITLAALPPAVLLYFWLRRSWRAFDVIRWLGLGSMLGVLLAGGVVVSTKIGGGSNLHNLDSFLVLVAIIATFVFFERPMPDVAQPAAESAPGPSSRLPSWALALAVLIPVGFALGNGRPLIRRDPAVARSVIEEIDQAVRAVRAEGHEVLFISERHLLTFDTITGAPLEPDYEKVFLMEMAMAGNPNYLGTFHSLLEARHFGLIVSHPLKIQFQGRNHVFGEENDAWVRAVSEPVLCYYAPAATFNEVGVQLLYPLPAGQACR